MFAKLISVINLAPNRCIGIPFSESFDFGIRKLKLTTFSAVVSRHRDDITIAGKQCFENTNGVPSRAVKGRWTSPVNNFDVGIHDGGVNYTLANIYYLNWDSIIRHLNWPQDFSFYPCSFIDREVVPKILPLAKGNYCVSYGSSNTQPFEDSPRSYSPRNQARFYGFIPTVIGLLGLEFGWCNLRSNNPLWFSEVLFVFGVVTFAFGFWWILS